MIFKLAITSGNTQKNTDGSFAEPTNNVHFDSDKLAQLLRNLPQDIQSAYAGLDYTSLLNLKSQAVSIIDNQDLTKTFDQLSNLLVTKEQVEKAFASIKHSATNALDKYHTISGTQFKHAYLVLYFTAIAHAGIMNKGSVADTNPSTQQDIAQAIQQSTEQTEYEKSFSNIEVEKQKPIGPVKVYGFTHKPTLSALVEFPVANNNKASIIYPETAATVMDSVGNANNILLPGVEIRNGVTQCAATARRVQEKIYSGNSFIVREEFDNDTDAIGYHMRASIQEVDVLKLKYPLLNRIIEINKITMDKKLESSDKFDLDVQALIGSNELGILTTTQSNSSVIDGHMVAVNNMYHIDGTVEGVYVYDPYLAKSIKKWHKKLDKSQKDLFALRKDDGHHIPIATYLEYCKNRGRIPLGIIIYNQPSTTVHMITNAKVSEDINIKQSDLKQFNDLYPRVVDFINENESMFGSDFLHTTQEQDIANFAQESRLSPFAVNKRGFHGIGQMNNKSLKAVYDEYPSIKVKFEGVTKIKRLDLEQMILASKLYKNGVIYKQINTNTDYLGGKSIMQVTDAKDAHQFVLAAYNRGSTGLAKIMQEYIKQTDNDTNITREQFSDYYVGQISAGKIKKQGYKELFGSDKDNRLGYVDGIKIQEVQLRGVMDKLQQMQHNPLSNPMLASN